MFQSVILLLAIAPVSGVSQGTKLPVQKAIEAQFPVTKPTADHKDIVTAGAVIDLLKDNLVMYSVDETFSANTTYKNGKFEASGLVKFQKVKVPFYNSKSSAVNRTFVAGEKFWLIGVDVRDDSTVLEFLSDPISDVRYKALVKYPYPSGGVPAPDVVVKQISETIKAEGGDEKAGAEAPAAPAAPAPVAAAKPIAEDVPPPPPSDAPPPAPKTISIGLTKDQVTAMFGPPTKVANPSATREIDFYPDMKVTFVRGKVTDIQ